MGYLDKAKEFAVSLASDIVAEAKEIAKKNGKKETEDNTQEANLSDDKTKKEPVKVVLAEDDKSLVAILASHFGLTGDKYEDVSVTLTMWGDGTASISQRQYSDVQLSEEDKTEIKTELESQISSLKENYETQLSAAKTKYDIVLAEKEELNTKYVTLKSDTKETIIDAPIVSAKVELSENPSQREVLIAMSNEKRKSNKN